MTPERAKELLPVIQAYAEGKKIEVKTPSLWMQLDNPRWDDYSKYRIAKEKKWYRVALCADGNDNQYTTTADSHYENDAYSEEYIQNQDSFIRWLGDRVYYDVN